MELSALMSTRYSVRQFQNRVIDKQVLNTILQAGQVAPTACNNQPQRILVVQDPDRLARLAAVTRYTFSAPCLLVVCSDPSVSWKRSYDGLNSATIDAGIVATHMILQAWALGVGSCWVCAFDPVKVRQALRIPEKYQIEFLLPMGYPAPNAVPSANHASRKPLQETVFYEEFPQ